MSDDEQSCNAAIGHEQMKNKRGGKSSSYFSLRIWVGLPASYRTA